MKKNIKVSIVNDQELLSYDDETAVINSVVYTKEEIQTIIKDLEKSLEEYKQLLIMFK